jgi:hypothetical protein
MASEFTIPSNINLKRRAYRNGSWALISASVAQLVSILISLLTVCEKGLPVCHNPLNPDSKININ